MPTVSSIEVEYGRSVQPAPYESQRAGIKLNLSFDQDEDAQEALDDAIDNAFDTVIAHVHARLGINTPTPASKPAKKADTKSAEEPKKENKTAAKDNEKPAKKSVAKSKEEKSEDGPSDADMVTAVTQKMKKLVDAGNTGGGTEIMKLLKGYINEAPFSPGRVPAENRTEFLEKLEALE